MISKKVLLDVISKYSLGGLVTQVKWSIRDKKLDIVFGGNTAGYKGKVEYDGDFTLKEGDYAIWSSDQLVKNISILNEDILIDAPRKNNTPTHINLADTNYEISFTLSDPANFESSPPKVVERPKPNASFDISDEFIVRYIKSTDVLASRGANLFSIKSAEGFTGSELVFNTQVGETSINFAIEADVQQEIKEYYFNSDLIRAILKANKNYQNGTFNLYIRDSHTLLIMLEFECEGIKTQYQINNTINS